MKVTITSYCCAGKVCMDNDGYEIVKKSILPTSNILNSYVEIDM